MVRRVMAVILLLVFLPGSTGFCLTTHFCTHSGTTYFSSWGKPHHRCDETITQKPAAVKEDCCAKKNERVTKKKSCCEKTTVTGITEKKQTGSHTCCSDHKTYHKLRHVAAAPALFLPLPGVMELPFITVAEEIFNSASANIFIPSPDPAPPPESRLLAEICTYRI